MPWITTPLQFLIGHIILGAGGAAQIHAGVLDVRHASAQHLLGVLQDRLAVQGRLAGQFLGALLGRGQDLRRVLLTALDDLLLAGQDAGALLCLIADALGLAIGEDDLIVAGGVQLFCFLLLERHGG